MFVAPIGLGTPVLGAAACFDVAVDDLVFKTILETRSIIEACARIA